MHYVLYLLPWAMQCTMAPFECHVCIPVHHKHSYECCTYVPFHHAHPLMQHQVLPIHLCNIKSWKPYKDHLEQRSYMSCIEPCPKFFDVCMYALSACKMTYTLCMCSIELHMCIMASCKDQTCAPLIHNYPWTLVHMVCMPYYHACTPLSHECVSLHHACAQTFHGTKKCIIEWLDSTWISFTIH